MYYKYGMNNPSLKPKYGLIDSFYRHIWIIVPDEQNAHYLKKTFWSKTQMLVFDLTQFKNYSTADINHSNNFDWAIDYTDLESPLIYATTINEAFNKTQTSYPSDVLIKGDTYSPIPSDIKHDLKNQMIFFNECVERLQAKCGRFLENPNEDFKVFFNDFTKIFQLELTLADIQEQVYQLAISNFRTNFFPPFVLINVLKRHYG